MDEQRLLVSPAPHFRRKRDTQSIMLDVIIALMPAFIAAVLFFGWRALLVVSVCVLTCVLGELGFQKLCKRHVTVNDFSAVVTGILLGFNLPYTIPIWQAVFGSVVAIIVVKQLFGGIGKNFANPAITARIVMMVSFASSMTSFSKIDGVSTATPLTELGSNKLLDLFLGNHAGSLGETCALALIIGGIYLICRRVITWHIPVTFIGSAAIFGAIAGHNPIEYILCGGLLLGAIFMATDYSTSPPTSWGKVIFGIGCGALTFIIRQFGGYNEGVSFAILIMNILTPYITTLTRKKPLGTKKAKTINVGGVKND
jgi:electron transport complex protein RnfD